jgi:hypothetical protein
MERQASDDTNCIYDTPGATTFDATPTNNVEEAGNPGGFTNNNQPTSENPAGVPKRSTVNPGTRGQR